MSTATTPESYAEKAARLTSNWQSGSGPLRLKKSTISNLFRYQPRGAAARRLSLGEFNHVLALDSGGRHGRGRGSHDLRDRRAVLLGARLPAARGTGAQAHHGRRRHGRHRHRVDVLSLRLRARRLARGGRAVARRHDRHGACRQRARRSLRRAAELLRHARLHPAREDRAAQGGAVRAPARAEIRRRGRLSRGDARRDGGTRSAIRRRFVLRGRPLLPDDGPIRRPRARVRRHRAQGRLLPARRNPPRHLFDDVRLHLSLRPRLVLERARDAAPSTCSAATRPRGGATPRSTRNTSLSRAERWAPSACATTAWNR